jgi:hypothetical protein
LAVVSGAAQRHWGLRVNDVLRVVTVPEEDGDFRALVKSAISSLDGEADSPRAALMTVLQRLLPSYPRLEIKQQDGLASFEPDPRTWYVYRDGSHRPSIDGEAR